MEEKNVISLEKQGEASGRSLLDRGGFATIWGWGYAAGGGG